MPFWVYILYSQSSDSFYKGQTADIFDRLRRHNAGSENATSKGIPWMLVWCCQKPDRSSALILERKLKNLSRNKLIIFMNKYKSDKEGPDVQLMLKSGC